jgi:hypothetical protein
MTFVKCVQTSELPVNEMTSEAQEPTQPADEIVIKLRPGDTSIELDKILKRHTEFVLSKEVDKYSNI